MCVFVGKAGILGSGAGMRYWDKFVPWLGSSVGMEIRTRLAKANAGARNALRHA